MSRRPVCPQTLDLFDDYEPPRVERFEPARVKGFSDRVRIARAVSETLLDAGVSRDDVAKRMSDMSDSEDGISKTSLDAYASPAKDAHTISLERAWLLLRATGDMRIFQMILETEGYVIIPADHLLWIELGMLAAKQEEWKKRESDLRRQAKRRMRS